MQTTQSVLTVMYDSFGNASFCFTLCHAYALVIVYSHLPKPILYREIAWHMAIL